MDLAFQEKIPLLWSAGGKWGSGLTNGAYQAASCLMSFGAAVLAAAALRGRRRTASGLSFGTGILLYHVVRTLLVECGWGFAALFGGAGGLWVQVLWLLLSALFFREWKAARKPDFRRSAAELAALASLQTGRLLLMDMSLPSDPAAALTGEALSFALLLTAVCDRPSEDAPSDGKGAFLFRTAGRACAVTLAAGLGSRLLRVGSAPAAPVLLTFGAAGLLAVLSERLPGYGSVSPVGLTAGLAAAFCVDAWSS